MGSFKIADLKPGDEFRNEIYILWNHDIKRASNGKFYLDLLLKDETGEISGKKWETSQAESDSLKPGILYIVTARISEYMGTLQMNVVSLRKADENTQAKIGDYVQSAPFSSEQMLKKVYNVIENMKDTDLKLLCKTAYDENNKQISYYPAAKALHHSIRGGYLYHIVTMLDIATALADIYKDVNKDLLLSGVLLHDIMKLRELDSNEVGIAEYSYEGHLIGHIEMGICYIGDLAERLNTPKNKETLLKHMILSHHYIPEHGSTKMPMFLEAELLHHIDVIDSRVYDFLKAYETLEKGKITERTVFSLDRRVLNPDFSE